jgi:RNA polymerase sigma-70 factor (ECF subfamily)
MLEIEPSMDEAGWITQAQAGDREAFCELVRCYRPRVINVIYHLYGDANRAEDVAQEAFIRAWQHLPHLQPHSSFRNWLYRIAVNAALDSSRREKAAIDIDAFEMAAPGESLEAGLEKQERVRVIQQAVLSLPEASRAVIILREYEGLSYREIAEALDISMGTVMSRLNYARTRLSEMLSQKLEVV